MKTVRIKIDSAKNSPRVELFVRIVWAIPTIIVLMVFRLVTCICLILQVLYILITGKREMGLNDVIKKYTYYAVKVNSYFNLVTDERSPILPED